MTDVDKYLLEKLSSDNICKTKKIMGVFIDELYCYITKEIINTKSITYFIEKILEEEPIEKIIISESVDDDIQTLLVNYLTKNKVKFLFTDDYDEETGAYMVFVAKSGIQRKEMEYKTDIPYKYLDHIGNSLCKNCYKEIEKINADYAKRFKKPSLFKAKECIVCKDTKENKEDFYL